MYSSFIEHKLIHEVQERLWEVEETGLLENDIYLRIEEKVLRQLGPFEHHFKPVLIHADPVPKNAIWTTDYRLILIDWDEAISGAWIADFTQLTYWHYYSNFLGGTGNSMKNQVRDGFFRGYGALEFGIEEIAAMESALHIIHSVDLLPFYQREKNIEAFKQTRDRLVILLEQN